MTMSRHALSQTVKANMTINCLAGPLLDLGSLALKVLCSSDFGEDDNDMFLPQLGQSSFGLVYDSTRCSSEE